MFYRLCNLNNYEMKFSFLEISFIFLSKYFEWEYYFWNEVWYQLKNFNTTIVYFRIKTKMINTKQLKHKTVINAIFVQKCILLPKHNCNPRESLHNCLRHQHFNWQTSPQKGVKCLTQKVVWIGLLVAKFEWYFIV